jgi:hypothetical protein
LFSYKTPFHSAYSNVFINSNILRFSVWYEGKHQQYIIITELSEQKFQSSKEICPKCSIDCLGVAIAQLLADETVEIPMPACILGMNVGTGNAGNTRNG